MKASARGRRLARHRDRLRSGSRLNLVSLMDIFTILVFFLLLNSSDVEVLQSDKALTLPESSAQQRPDSTLLLVVTRTDLVLGGRPLVSVAQVMARPEEGIEELAGELRHQAGRSGERTAGELAQGRAITIMGDKAIPYALLKRIMKTCVDNDYRNIALAVNRVARSTGAPPEREG